MNLFKVELKKNFKGSIIWGIVLSGIIFLYMAFFPSMSDASFSELLDSKLNMLPQGLLDSFGLSEIPNFSVFMEYYCYVFQFIVIGLAIYAMILGTKALSKEEGDKTIEFLYSKPITRNKIIISKMISSIISIITVLLFMLVTSLITDFIFGNGSNIKMIIIVNLMMLIPIFVYWSIGFAISSFLKDDNKSIVIALGLFFGTYLIGVIANTVDELEILKYLSPINYNTSSSVFKYFDGRKNADLDTISIIISTIVFVGSIITTYIKYNKKDLLN